VKSATQRTLVAVALLIFGGGISAYLWIAVGVGESQVDPVIAAAMESFTCDKCGHVFEKSVGDITKMRRARGDVFCPECGEPGARKNIVSTLIELKRPTLTVDHALRDPGPDTEEDAPVKPEPPKAVRERIEDDS
jgi:rubredoxin